MDPEPVEPTPGPRHVGDASNVPVAIEVGRLLLDPEIHEWIIDHGHRNGGERWTPGEAIRDLLGIAYRSEMSQQAGKKDQESWLRKYKTALGAMTEEQLHALAVDNVCLNLAIAVGEAENALAAAERLGLRVRWYEGDREVERPGAWPLPRLPDPGAW
ncbi:hypothetical protein [Actinoplanes sp. NPDC049802]|uniref:hypothetical protein n=1 Tax=Actinoplanes sp. NPDC049802 TaxID=3154742 RepID=UPI0033E57074